MIRTLFFGLLAAFAEILGGVLVVYRRKWPRLVQEYLMAVSAGFLLALVFLKLIPESLRLLGPGASVYILVGFALLHFFEHTLVGHLHFGEETHADVMVSRVASLSAFSGLVVHAFFDGFSISAGMTYDFYIGFLVFVAILLHKIPEGLTIATIMLAAQQTRRKALLASASLGLATIVGVFVVFLLKSVGPETVGIAFALSAGLAAYVGASDLIPEINRSGKRATPILVLGGMIAFYVGDLLLESLLRQGGT
jgi:zinc transporter ZupT